MADRLMADLDEDEDEFINIVHRPVHLAVIGKKLPCSVMTCKQKASIQFFDGEVGLAQHYRAKHPGIQFNETHVREARRQQRFLHGQETLKYLQQISQSRQSEGDKYEKYTITTSYEACKVLEFLGQDPQECAKLVGMVLYHFGQLKSYGEGAKAELIEVCKSGLAVKFHLWYLKTTTDAEKLMTVIKTEAILVKRDLAVSSLQESTTPVTVQDGEMLLTGDKPLDVMRGIFKLQEFRGKQREVINSIAEKRNTLVVLPTGGGKTICYAVPALMEEKITVVIVPILALLFDQVERMRGQGLNACYIMSDMEEEEKEAIMHKLYSQPPDYNFLFLTPETALSLSVFDLLKNLCSLSLINFWVIDEAHCIDTWGFHFRPSYGDLWQLSTLGCPVLVMTGTATERTQEVIMTSLRLSQDTVIIRQSTNRPNLVYHVVDKKADGKNDIVELIKKKFSDKCGIVYCTERRETVDLTYHLKLAGVNAVFFHAGMDASEKQQNIQSWKYGAAHVMCATVAFGMGIDKKNVSFVIHHSIPKDLESYAQESGRAGRDGCEAHCFIFFRFEDRTKHLRNIAALPDSDRKLVCLNGLNDIVKYCITPTCRRKQIVQYFDNSDTSGDVCNQSCDICVNNTSIRPVDRSEDAILVLKCLDSMQEIEPKVTTKVLIATFRGSKANAIISKGFASVMEYGMGKSKFTEKALYKFVQFMIIRSILEEQLRPVNDKITTPYLAKGMNAVKLLNKEISFYF